MGCSTSVLRPAALGSGRPSFLHLSGRFQPPFSYERPLNSASREMDERAASRSWPWNVLPGYKFDSMRKHLCLH
jgi:hypothetical protein